jgi:hypothetical protein
MVNASNEAVSFVKPNFNREQKEWGTGGRKVLVEPKQQCEALHLLQNLSVRPLFPQISETARIDG